MEKDASVDAVSVTPADAVDPLVLTIDVGTSSVRSLVYDARGRMVRDWEVHRPYLVETTADGGVFVDPQELMRLVQSCVDAVLQFVGKPADRIAAVACDTFWHSLMGVDGSGRPLTPLYTWADTRSSECASTLRHQLDERVLHSRTGVVFHSSYLPAKLLWIQKTYPDVMQKVSYWMSFGEYLYLRLFGQRRVSISMASGTGLLDQNTCVWDEELLAVLPMHVDQLSPLAEFCDAAIGLVDSFKVRWTALANIPWYLPLGDGGCNNVGSGGFSPEWVVAMIGTSGALRVVNKGETAETPWGLWTYRIDRQRYVQGGALSDGGNVYGWLKDTLRLDPLDLDRKLMAQKPDSHGLTILPFLAGERSPDWNLSAQAAFVGMTLDTKPLSILQASLEAVAYRFALIYAILKRDVNKPQGIIGSGAGLLHSPAWVQIMSDVLGEPLVISAVPEASSRGAALLVLEAMGVLAHLSDAPAPMGKKHEPQPNNTEIYRAAIERQQDVYSRLFK